MTDNSMQLPRREKMHFFSKNVIIYKCQYKEIFVPKLPQLEIERKKQKTRIET